MTDSPKQDGTQRSTARAKKRQWHYHPELPIQISPLFRRPFDLKAVFTWFLRSWFPLTERLLILSLALTSWFFFHPALIRCQVFAFDWIVEIFVRNLVLIFVVAGGLHLYFYHYKKILE